MKEIKVLDHGSVILRNLAGPTRRTMTHDMESGVIGMRPFDADDIDPAQAARMSFEQMDTDRTYEQDMKLNKYLLVMGALAERQITLTALVNSNRGHQMADVWENELRHLERAAHLLSDAKWVEP